MASCMYRVGGKYKIIKQLNLSLNMSSRLDYVYFEGNPSDPYLIRRIEELNKVSCFYMTCRRTDAIN